ncbi:MULTISPECIES: phosphodiester glycosidase family protein [Clostridium]|uniref:Phosphodiester glycosidase family protein n=1 Tax=Clostridium cibarium TaxID=2762247 RepID=A0ABR8PT57_9CLOT|nr:MULTISPECIES: phosphodiester glycosidase family protein [Clostridium]MBD7911357.1 phosphodiester glycosidase family protein [Clostridium cibarium]
MEKKVRRKIKKDNRVIRKFSWKLLIGFMIFQLFFTVITAPFILFYGPFQNAKSMFVGGAMGSMHYQWLATTFLSKEQINKILGKSEVEEDVSTDGSGLISIPKNHDDNIKYATLENNDKFRGHVLTVSDPTRIKIGYTSKLKKEGETTSQIAENNKAVAGVNGGAFSDEANSQAWTANGGTPSGVIITGGKVIYDDTSGSKQGTILMTKDGRLVAGNYTTKELLSKGASEAVSFNTDILVSNGKAAKLQYHMGGSSPRTIIGQKQDGSILLVVLDSKNNNRIAATLDEAQEIMLDLGCVTAATLDGGKSATMYYNDEVVNTPSYAFGERYIPTAVIVK